MKNALFLFLLSILVGCGGQPKLAAEVYDTLYAPIYAKHFVVLSQGDSAVLRVIDPWQGAAGVSCDYTLGAIERVVCMSSSHAAFLDTLGAAAKVVGVSAADYYTNPIFAKLPDVGFDNSLNVELLIALKPQIITAYELSGENNSAIGRMSDFGIKPIYVADYLEENPLGRAEWVVAFGAMMGQIDKAKSIFQGVADRYNSLKDSVVAQVAERCRVMLNSPYKGVWYLPGDSTYMVRLIVDAGGQYVARGNADNISHTVDTEVAYSKLITADVWLNPSANIVTRKQLMAQSPLLRNVKAKVFSNTARASVGGGSDFWESGVVRPDVVLLDLVKVFHPEAEAVADHTLYYYKELR